MSLAACDYGNAMSSVLHPVGPEDPGIYWRRRAVVFGGLLIAIVLLLLLLSQCGAGGTPSASPTPTPTPTPTTTSSGTPTPTASPSPSSTPSSTSTADAPLCADTAIAVGVSTNKEVYAAGEEPQITMVITNTSDAACRRDVGASANEVKISSGGVHVWSSDDCSPDNTADVQLLEPGAKAQLTLTWGRLLSSEGCPDNRTDALAGTYEVIGRNDGVESAPARFVLS